MHKDKIDNIDIFILETLQKEGRKKRKEIAEQVGLSLPSVSERFQKLEELGYIRGYFAKLDHNKVGLDVAAFIFIVSESSAHYQEVIELAEKDERILECHAITGKGSHLLKVRVASMIELEKLLSDIQAWPGVKNTTTDMVLSTTKETSCLSVSHLKNDQ